MVMPVLTSVYVVLNTLTNVMCVEQTILPQKLLHKTC